LRPRSEARSFRALHERPGYHYREHHHHTVHPTSRKDVGTNSCAAQTLLPLPLHSINLKKRKITASEQHQKMDLWQHKCTLLSAQNVRKSTHYTPEKVPVNNSFHTACSETRFRKHGTPRGRASVEPKQHPSHRAEILHSALLS